MEYPVSVGPTVLPQHPSTPAVYLHFCNSRRLFDHRLGTIADAKTSVQTFSRWRWPGQAVKVGQWATCFFPRENSIADRFFAQLK